MLQVMPLLLEDTAKTHGVEDAFPVCLTCMTISYPLLLLLLRPKCVIKTSC